MNEANWECSPQDTGLPRRAFSKIAAATFSGAKIREAMVHAVVGKAATLRVKKIMPRTQRAQKIRKARDINITRTGETRDPRLEHFRRIDRQRFVRAKRGQHPRRQSRGGNGLVRLQVVRRAVRGAKRIDVEFFQDALRGQFRRGELFVGALPDARRAGFIQQFIDAEITLQLQMSPVIKRIAQRVRHRRGPGAEFFKWHGLAGAEALAHPVGPHGPPFVMVAFEPDVKKIVELPVARDVLRRKVAMIIKRSARARRTGDRCGAPVAVCSKKSSVDEFHKTRGLLRFLLPGFNLPAAEMIAFQNHVISRSTQHQHRFRGAGRRGAAMHKNIFHITQYQQRRCIGLRGADGDPAPAQWCDRR